MFKLLLKVCFLGITSERLTLRHFWLQIRIPREKLLWNHISNVCSSCLYEKLALLMYFPISCSGEPETRFQVLPRPINWFLALWLYKWVYSYVCPCVSWALPIHHQVVLVPGTSPLSFPTVVGGRGSCSTNRVLGSCSTYRLLSGITLLTVCTLLLLFKDLELELRLGLSIIFLIILCPIIGNSGLVLH